MSELTQKYWKNSEDRYLTDLVWKDFNVTPYHYSEAVLLGDSIIWGHSGHELEKSKYKFLDCLKISKWEKDHWSITTAISLYNPQTGIPDPITVRDMDQKVEAILDVSGGYLLWNFQFFMLLDLLGIGRDKFEDVRKSFNQRKADPILELCEKKVCNDLSLWDIYTIRGDRGIRKHPEWDKADRLIQSGVL